MSIASSMSQGFSIKDGVWSFTGKYNQNVKPSYGLKAPTNDDQALVVLRIEAQMRLSKEYVDQQAKYLKQKMTP